MDRNEARGTASDPGASGPSSKELGKRRMVDVCRDQGVATVEDPHHVQIVAQPPDTSNDLALALELHHEEMCAQQREQDEQHQQQLLKGCALWERETVDAWADFDANVPDWYDMDDTHTHCPSPTTLAHEQRIERELFGDDDDFGGGVRPPSLSPSPPPRPQGVACTHPSVPYVPAHPRASRHGRDNYPSHHGRNRVRSIILQDDDDDVLDEVLGKAPRLAYQ